MMVVLGIDAYTMGTNLGRLEGYRLIIQALGGVLESVQARPFSDEYWRLDITVLIPPASQERATELAPKMFDGAVDVRERGTREGNV